MSATGDFVVAKRSPPVRGTRIHALVGGDGAGRPLRDRRVGTPSAAFCLPKQILLQHYPAGGAPRGSVADDADDIATKTSQTAGIDGYGNVAVIWKELRRLQARLYQGF